MGGTAQMPILSAPPAGAERRPTRSPCHTLRTISGGLKQGAFQLRPREPIALLSGRDGTVGGDIKDRPAFVGCESRRIDGERATVDSTPSHQQRMFRPTESMPPMMKAHSARALLAPWAARWQFGCQTALPVNAVPGDDETGCTFALVVALLQFCMWV